MHDFRYRQNQLFCESAKVSDIVSRYGTPLYIYSKRTLIDHYQKLKKAFRTIEPLILYSMKANSNLTLCKILSKAGAGFDIVSGGELYRALKIGANPEKIVYAGVGKTEEEIESCIRNNILMFNVESLSELKLIDRIARRLKRIQMVAIRINPKIRPKTHRYILTSGTENKFGVDIETAKEIFLHRDQYRNLSLVGVHIHIGSQIVESGPFVKAIKKLTIFIKELNQRGVEIKWFNIGGGLGIIYSKETPQTAEEYAKEVSPLIKGLDLKIILEPGRFIVGNAGILVTKILSIKETSNKNFLVVDAGMNDFLRPSLYCAYHSILPVISRPYSPKKKIKMYDVVGPVCESGDFFGLNRRFIEPKEGDLLAIMGAGAYGFSMSSNYNARPRSVEVLVDGRRVDLIRRRETYQDLIRQET